MSRTTAEYRAARAVELSLQGWTYHEIAGQLGFRDRSGAWRAVRRCLQRRQAAAADAFLAGAFTDLEIVHERVWGRAAAGDLKAARVVLRAIEDRVRLVEVLSTRAVNSEPDRTQRDRTQRHERRDGEGYFRDLTAGP